MYVCMYICKHFFCFYWFKERKSKYFKMNRSTKRFEFLEESFFRSYICVCLQLASFAREHMWCKANQ